MTRTADSLRTHWFLLLAPCVLVVDLIVWRTGAAAATPRLLEAGLLGDLCVLVPALYLACYWRRGRAAWLRAGGLAALGLWGVSKLLPANDHGLLAELWPLRYLAMGALAVLELKVAVAVYRAVIGGASRQEAAERLQGEAGMPAWAARLAAAEAAFWAAGVRRVRAWVSGRRGR